MSSIWPQNAVVLAFACLVFLYLAYLGIVAQEGIIVYGEDYLPPLRVLPKKDRWHWLLCANLFLVTAVMSLFVKAGDLWTRKRA